MGVPLSGSGYSPKGGAVPSPAEPSIPNASFTQEYPHLTSLLRHIGLFLLGLVASTVVMAVCMALGMRPYVYGWLSCMAFLLASRTWKPEQ